MDRSEHRRLAIMLAVVGAVALLARFLYLQVLHGQGIFFGLFLDSAHYASQAAQIRSGHGIGDHPYLFSPAYPYLVALFTDASGELNVPWLQRLQALFGAGTAIFTALVGLRLGGTAVAWIAGLTAAAYGPFIHLDSMVLVASPQTFFYTLALWLVVIADRSLPRWVGAGGALGLSVVLRPTGLAIAAVAVVVLLAVRRWKPAAGLLLALILVIAPFTARNVVRTGEWVLLSANGGINFWVGNNARSIGLYRLPPGTDFVNDPLSKRNAELETGRPLTYKEASRWWSGKALGDIREDPFRWVRLMARKGFYFLNPKEISQLGSSYHWYRERAWPLRFPLDARWIFVLALALPFLHGRFHREGLLWTACFLAVYAAGICLFFVTGRHRSPLMPAAIVLACCTAVGLWGSLRDGSWRGRPVLVIGPVLTLLLLGGASHALYRPGALYHVSERTGLEERHHGMALFDAARYDEAVDAYRKSLAIQEDPITRTNLANALKAAGRIDEAAEEYRASLRLHPNNPITWYNYGILQARDRGDAAEAERAYLEAIRLAPLMPEPHLKLGELYLATGRTDGAIREIERCLELAPPGATVRARAEQMLARARSRQAGE